MICIHNTCIVFILGLIDIPIVSVVFNIPDRLTRFAIYFLDIDECDEESERCGMNSVCTNTMGGFHCDCLPGFNGTGVNCTDDNECLRSPCHPRAKCTNVPSNYSCECLPGYSGNGTDCMGKGFECKLVAFVVISSCNVYNVMFHM